MSQHRLIVTGGAGFIGANLVHYLAEKLPDAQIAIVDKLTYAGNKRYIEKPLQRGGISLHEIDIADVASMNRLFAELEPTGVLHLAAESHVDRSISGPSAFIHSNIVGTFALLELARSHWIEAERPGRFLHVSTDEVYGSLGPEGAFTEDTPYDPSSPYSASKASSDHLVRAYHRTYGLDAVITNCSNNYGPYQYPEKLIPVIIRNIRDRQPLPVYGDGKNVRDWLYVVDHVEALWTVFDKGESGRSYNIGTENEWENIKLVRLLCDLVDELTGTTDSQELISFVTDRPGHDRRYAIDPSRIREELGWQPKHSFEDSIRYTVQWYLENFKPLWGV